MSNDESTRPHSRPDPLPASPDPAEIARIAQQLAVREQQQAAIASLGLRALETPELQTFMDHAVREVQRTLGVDYVKILELQPNGQMLLRAGVGWAEGVVGHTTIAWDTDGQAAYTLREQSPLIVEDLAEERRFVAPDVLLDHEIRSGISCVIRDGDGSYGVFGIHSRSPRTFRREDTDFVVAAAAVITAAVNRHQSQLRMELESALARAHTEAANLIEAAKIIHTSLSEPLHVAVGELWEPSPEAPDRLRRTVLSMVEPSNQAHFETVFSRADEWTRGQGTIGRALERRHAEWISLRKATGEDTPQATLARQLGLESGLVIPVSVDDQAIAVLTVFSRRWLHANSAFLRGLDTMGRALGEFARRREVESKAAWLAAITASAQDAVTSQDFEGTVTGWLEGAERLYGYEQREVLGSSFDVLVPEDRRDELRAAVFQIRAGELVQPFETQRIRKDGVTIHVSVRLAPIRDPKGVIIGISATDRDVTQQRLANEALSASERRFRSTFDNAAVGMAHVGLDGRFLRVNDRLLEILRYTRGALLQRRFQDITHPQHLAQDIEGVAALIQGTREHYTAEKRYVRGDGSVFWANVTSATVRNPHGEAEYFVTVIEDIEDRKRSAAELRESEWRFRQMVVHSPVPLMVFDREGRIVALSRSWTDLSGYRPDELPTVHAWVEKAYREDPTGTGESVDLQWQLDDASEPTERDIWTSYGERRTVLIQTMGLGDGDDSRLRICAAADITTQQQAARELLEASRQKDEFLAMLSHELRNPLAAVRSATDLIKSLRGNESELVRPLTVLERQIAHMAKLLDGLLDLSRVVRGSIVLEPTLLDARALIRDVLDDLEPSLSARGIELVETVPEEPIWLHADPIRITQVIDNLLSNAIKYTDGVGTIVVDLHREADLAVLTVSDTGLGIDAELLPHVFDTFRQARQTLDRSRGGLGLGLALVRTLVERHQGTVTAHSEGPGRGSQFVVTLPVVPGPTRREPAPAAKEALERVPKILIVEDNEDAAEMLDHALRMRGFETRLASHGLQALELASTETFDVVLCDVGLPMGMSGFDVARRLRSDAGTRHLKLVALTGYGTPEDRRKTRDAGFDAHLTKPVDFHLLTSTLEQLVGLNR